MGRVIGIVFLHLLFCFDGGGMAAAADQFVDPMRPVAYQSQTHKSPVAEKQAQVKTRDWQLTAVLTSQGRSIAVINGTSLQLGEQLEGYELVQIYSDRVMLKNKQEKLVLRRAGTGLKKVSINRGTGKGSKP